MIKTTWFRVRTWMWLIEQFSTWNFNVVSYNGMFSIGQNFRKSSCLINEFPYECLNELTASCISLDSLTGYISSVTWRGNGVSKTWKANYRPGNVVYHQSNYQCWISVMFLGRSVYIRTQIPNSGKDSN